MTQDAREAIRLAMQVSGKTPQEVRALSIQMFGKANSKDLTDSQRWTIVATLDPNAIGPYGETMAPF